jgi:hypothetical protein
VPERVYETSSQLVVRVPVTSGPHAVGVAFYRKPPDLVEQVREPFPNPRISGNDGGPGGAMPIVTSLTIIGPHDAAGPGDTPSRRRIFICRAESAAHDSACARRIVERLARRAYRGNAGAEDLDTLVAFYDATRIEGGSFDAGIESALPPAARGSELSLPGRDRCGRPT